MHTLRAFLFLNPPAAGAALAGLELLRRGLHPFAISISPGEVRRHVVWQHGVHVYQLLNNVLD